MNDGIKKTVDVIKMEMPRNKFLRAMCRSMDKG